MTYDVAIKLQIKTFKKMDVHSSMAIIIALYANMLQALYNYAGMLQTCSLVVFLIPVHPSHHQVIESIARLVVACGCSLSAAGNRMILLKAEDSGTAVCVGRMQLRT